MAEPLVTEVGAVVKSDPELKFTTGGFALCTFGIRVKDRGEEARFVNVAVWRDLAENVAESVRLGDRVIVRGPVKTREYEKSDGSTGVSSELNAWSVGLELSYATAQAVRTERTKPAAEAPVPDF